MTEKPVSKKAAQKPRARVSIVLRDKPDGSVEVKMKFAPELPDSYKEASAAQIAGVELFGKLKEISDVIKLTEQKRKVPR